MFSHKVKLNLAPEWHHAAQDTLKKVFWQWHFHSQRGILFSHTNSKRDMKVFSILFISKQCTRAESWRLHQNDVQVFKAGLHPGRCKPGFSHLETMNQSFDLWFSIKCIFQKTHHTHNLDMHVFYSDSVDVMMWVICCKERQGTLFTGWPSNISWFIT